jgi:hypothetical protein
MKEKEEFYLSFYQKYGSTWKNVSFWNISQFPVKPCFWL